MSGRLAESIVTRDGCRPQLNAGHIALFQFVHVTSWRFVLGLNGWSESGVHRGPTELESTGRRRRKIDIPAHAFLEDLIGKDLMEPFQRRTEQAFVL